MKLFLCGRFLRPVLAGLAVAMLAFAGTPSPATATPLLPGASGWPLAGTPIVVHGFDPPPAPWQSGHRGVDLAAVPGTSVLTAADGVVAFAGEVAGRPVVTIDHGHGLHTTYEPVVSGVAVGDRLVTGQSLGRVGSESHCLAGCLHWGLRRGESYLDPLGLVRGFGSSGGGTGGLRLVGADRRSVVQQAARERARLASAPAPAGPDPGDEGPRPSRGERAAGRSDPAPGGGGHHGFLHPVPGGITSPFGLRVHPVLHIRKLHDGTDFGAGCGTPIRATYDGRVSAAYANAGYGNRLLIDHGPVDGRAVVTAYNHAQRYVVHVGDHVRRGRTIGYVGSTGYSTGCHLHLMVWLDGRLVDPMSWL